MTNDPASKPRDYPSDTGAPPVCQEPGDSSQPIPADDEQVWIWTECPEFVSTEWAGSIS